MTSSPLLILNKGAGLDVYHDPERAFSQSNID